MYSIYAEIILCFNTNNNIHKFSMNSIQNNMNLKLAIYYYNNITNEVIHL
jgi:hypothetical protein